jgi:ankyrin repeat protein
MNLREASRYGYIEKVKEALANGEDPTETDNYAIQVACIYGHTEIVSLLLQDGRADPTTNYNSSLRWASRQGHTKVVEVLLQDGRVQDIDSAIEVAETPEIKEMLVKYKYRADDPEYMKMKDLTKN